MRILTLTTISLLSLLRNNARATTIEDILSQCRVDNLNVDECRQKIEATGEYKDAKIITAQQRQITDDTYYQVIVPVDYRGYVLGRGHEFEGKVPYPFEWRGNPEYGPGTRYVGPWDCKGLTDMQCCAMIEQDVPDPDINNNHLECWLEESYYRDPVSNQLFEVYLNPVDSSINYLNAEQLINIEASEANARTALISDINETLAMTSCPKETLGSLHARILHAVRGIQIARPFPKYTKDAVRQMNQEGIETLDVTQNEGLQFAFPLIEKVLQAISNNGGVHHHSGTDGFIVLQVGDDNKVQSVGRFEDADHPEEDVLVNCISQNLDVNDCAHLLSGVRVVTVQQRSITDEFYNQVVVPIDYRGIVIGVQPKFDGLVYYMFDWRGSEEYGLGTRRVGPWDCKGLTDVECCEKIETDIVDPDVNGNYIDCWLEETFYTDPFTGTMNPVVYDTSDGVVKYATGEQVAAFQALELDSLAKLMTDIDHVLQMVDCPKETLWNIYHGVRHAVRGDPAVQGDPQKIRNVIRNAGDTIDVASNGVLQSVLAEVRGRLSSGRQNLNADGGFVVLVVDQNDTVERVSRFVVGSNA